MLSSQGLLVGMERRIAHTLVYLPAVLLPVQHVLRCAEAIARHLRSAMARLAHIDLASGAEPRSPAKARHHRPVWGM